MLSQINSQMPQKTKDLIKKYKQIFTMIPQQSAQTIASICYFYSEEKEQCPLPLLSTNYNILIKNNFAKLQLEQIYTNPFEKSLEIHYAIPTDPEYSISGLRVVYQNVQVIGMVMEKEKAKFEYKSSMEKGETVMMANYSKTEPSILKIKIGNIQPLQKVKIYLDLIGPLNAETQDQLTLRVPSHIGPRYSSFKDFISQFYNKLHKQIQNKSMLEAYLNPVIEWSFQITLQCSQKVKSWSCSTHDLKPVEISPNTYYFSLENAELPQVDLEFNYIREKDDAPMITYGQKCMCLTFIPPEITTKSNKKFDFVFLLDRSGSMQGPSIKAAKQALLLYLKSLPQNSKFNVISFGSNYEFMFPTSQLYTQQIVMKAQEMISKFQADFGGTQINSPLQKILQNSEHNQQGYERHLILLTDGQVSDTEQVIQTIKKIKNKNIANTHTVGVGSGFSMDLIKRGAQTGEGNYIVIINTNNMTKKIIGLLQSIIKPKLKNFQLQYNVKLFNENKNKIPSSLRKGTLNSFYLQYDGKAGPIEQILNGKQKILIKYFDQQTKKQVQQVFQLKCQSDQVFPQLDKFYAKKQIQDLLEISSNQVNKKKAIQISENAQILCKYTAFLCKVKENANPNQKKISYYLKMKSALEGKSQLFSNNSIGDVFVKTLTGKSLTFTTSMFITGYQLKQMVQEVEGIPVDQQRMIFAGKQIENDRTLDEIGMQHQSTAHLVLRLRGDGGGSSSSGVSSGIRIFGLQILINEMVIKLRQPQICATSSVSALIQNILKQMPNIKNLSINLTFNNQKLDENKLLTDYPQIKSGSKLIVNGVPIYISNVNEIIKLFKINGSWQYNEEIIKSLSLEIIFEKKVQKYGDKNKAMTETILQYLKKSYPQKKQEFSLIYKKANEFLKI